MKHPRMVRISPVVGGFAAGILVGGLLAGIAVADQPHMQSARHHLEQARDELKEADKDKGGHREKAIDYVRRAMDECDAGMRFDREHNKRR